MTPGKQSLLRILCPALAAGQIYLRWSVLLLLPLLFARLPAHCQGAARTPHGDLKKLSTEQLKSCLEQKGTCGNHDIYEISDELARRLRYLPTDTLVRCFADWKICGAADDLASGWQISDEIARRGFHSDLLRRYWSEPNEEIRDGIVDVAYHFRNPEVESFMKKVLETGHGDEDEIYWPANYLAKRCDPDALKWLSTRKDRPEGCMIWAPSVALFGKCAYRPAIPYLIENSLDDACLNIDDTAARDLKRLYPKSPKQFSSLNELRNYYCHRANDEGFSIDCSSNPPRPRSVPSSDTRAKGAGADSFWQGREVFAISLSCRRRRRIAMAAAGPCLKTRAHRGSNPAAAQSGAFSRRNARCGP